MAMNLGGSTVKSDINVTPLVDVVLVLLIIFMVVTPMLQKGFDMEIPPEVQATSAVPDTEKFQLILTIRGDNRLFLNKEEVERPNLENEVSKAIMGRKDKLMFVQADGGLDYEYVVKLVDICRGAGIENVALITKENLDLSEGAP